MSTQVSIYCLNQYLQPIKEMLCSGNLQDHFDIHESANRVAHILKCLQQRRIHHPQAHYYYCTTEVQIENSKVMEVSIYLELVTNLYC